MAGLAMDQRDGWIWFNGEMVPWREAKVHLLTHGLHYASSIFEGNRAYDGRIFKLHQHSERLINSGRILDVPVPYSADELDAACNEVLAKNGLTDAYLRPFAWRGAEEMGLLSSANKVHVAVAAWEWPSYFTPEEKLKGIKLMVSKWKRPSPETAPHDSKAAGLYMICTMSKNEATKQGFGDALMHDHEGYVAEATSANIFLIKDGVFHTPTPDRFLNGLTRQTAIEMAKARGIEVIERRIRPEELGDFDECFLTGTAAEITPVAAVEDITFTPGKYCKMMMDDYEVAIHSPS